MNVATQIPIVVRDEDGFVIGEYVADMLVDGVLVELKAVSTLLPVHAAQTLNYLKATGIEHGFLVNFGSYRFECQKFVLRNATSRRIDGVYRFVRRMLFIRRKERKEHKDISSKTHPPPPQKLCVLCVLCGKKQTHSSL